MRRRRRSHRRGTVAVGVMVVAALALGGYAGARLISRGSREQAAGTPPAPSASSSAPSSGGASAAPSTAVSGPKAPPGRPVPILMYHVINAPPAGTPFPDLWLPEPDFAAQMRYLAAHGFHAVTLAQVWAYWTTGAALPIHPIVLSFDDGYQSQFGSAAKILHRLHWAGVLNLVVDHVTERDIAAVSVRRMIDWGWEVDSHTVTHLDLTTLSPARLQYEVSESRRWLRHEFGVPVDFFCYPAGAFDAAVIAAVRRAGYLGATTELPGPAVRSEPDTLHRIRVSGGEPPGILLTSIAQP
jgi:peptidoglycan/xylan/chitin deacetylase (PgdA/CDA1 family)